MLLGYKTVEYMAALPAHPREEPSLLLIEPVEKSDENRENGNKACAAKAAAQWYQDNQGERQSIRIGDMMFVEPKTQGNKPARN